MANCNSFLHIKVKCRAYLIIGDPFFLTVRDMGNSYTKMRSGMERRVIKRCIEEGELITTKAPAVGRSMVKAIASSLFGHNTEDAMYRRVLICLTFLVSGRSGESGTATWNLTTWDHIMRNVSFDWSQSKTSKQKGVTMVSDYENYDMDFYHCLGSFLICNYGQRSHLLDEEENHWIFPEIAALEKNGHSKKLSNFLQDLSPTSTSVEYSRSIVRELPSDVSGNSLRVGSINEASARNVSPYAIIMHGGHDCAGQSASFEYIVTTPMSALPGNRYHIVRMNALYTIKISQRYNSASRLYIYSAAMALAGYPSHYYTDSTSFHVPASPDLRIIMKESNQQMMNNFINHLFNVREKHFSVGRKLRPLLECLFATIIMYHGEILASHGALHVVSKAVIRSAKEFQVTDKVLEEWGGILKSDWRIRNTKASSNSSENRALMEIIIAQNEAHVKAYMRQELMITTAVNELQNLKKTVGRYEGMMKDLLQYSQESPQKRKKTEGHNLYNTNLLASFLIPIHLIVDCSWFDAGLKPRTG